MSNLETLDVGQANELKLAFRRTGWTNEELKWLCEGNVLADFRNVKLGFAEIKPILHLIDCDAAPFVPNGWTVEEHRKSGQFKFSPATVNLYLSKGQKNNKRIEGAKLRTELAKKPVLNANVLDHLLKPENQNLIPEDWKGKYVYFWGTIYRGRDGDLRVRYLRWSGVRWSWDAYWLDGVWGGSNPAAVPAKN